jgi:hypothetical protein
MSPGLGPPGPGGVPPGAGSAAGASGSPLRRRVLVAIMTVSVVAVLLFALPLALAVQRLYRTETVTAMERDATRAATVIPD